MKKTSDLTPRKYQILTVVGLIAALVLIYWLASIVLGNYHLIQGSTMMDQAAAINPVPAADGFACAYPPLSPGPGRELVEQGFGELQEALQYQPHLTQALLRLGQAHCQLGEPEQAAEAYEAFIVLRPQNPLGYIGLALAYEASCREDEPTAETNRAVPTNPFACADENLQDRIREAWTASGVTITNLLDTAKQALNTDRATEAMAWYERARQVYPQSSQVWYETGLAFEAQNEWANAINAYKTALDKGPGSGPGASSLHYYIGRILQSNLAGEQLDTAREHFEMAIESDDFANVWDKADNYHRLGSIFRQEGRSNTTYLPLFEQALALNPNHTNAHILLGMTYYYEFDDFERAEREIMQALEISPTSLLGIFQLGEIYRQAGFANKAIEMYNRALAIDPNYNRAINSLESLLENQN